MVILEGPDGGGKSSLAQRISTRFGIPLAPRASDSIEGPVPDLQEWTKNDLATWQGMRIYDRYPLISEPIYSVLCRDGAPSKLSPAFMEEMRERFLAEAFVIFCLPPLRRVKEVVERVPQMKGVRDNIALIWRAYDSLTRSYAGKSFVYDYSVQHESQEKALSDRIVGHLRERLS